MKNYLTATISASALRHNITVLRALIAPGVKLCPVVKDDCYGHGLNIIYHVLAEHVDGFAVASPVAALRLREMGWEGFVLCFLSAYFDDYEVQDELVRKNVTHTVMSMSALSCIQSAAKRVGRRALVHLKVDTGMGRLGVPSSQARDMIKSIRSVPEVELTGIYTHFASADEADRSSVAEQLVQFHSVVDGCEGLTLHAAGSAAMIDFPESHFDMVRPGIAVYGCHPSGNLVRPTQLRPCMSVFAKLIAVKHLPKGSCCGYGLTHCFKRDSRVAVVPIGYGDGYFRALSGKAVVRINGAAAPVCGRVSMDQMTVDVTDIPEVHVGDKVEIISADPLAPNSVENLARLADTIPYEITCHLGHNIRQSLAD